MDGPAVSMAAAGSLAEVTAIYQIAVFIAADLRNQGPESAAPLSPRLSFHARQNTLTSWSVESAAKCQSLHLWLWFCPEKLISIKLNKTASTPLMSCLHACNTAMMIIEFVWSAWGA